MDNDETILVENLIKLRFSQMIINEKIKNGDFKIPIHLALGHEAIAVSTDFIMDEKDQLVLTHRNIHYNLAREKNLKLEIDEYLLKKNGLAGGQLGSMNLANKGRGIMYTSSILGNNMPVATGLALGKKIKSESGIVIVVTGDGAIEEGAFYESILFMKSHNLPVMIIVENNGWSLGTKIEERRCPIDLEKLTDSLGIKYRKLVSNDVFDYVKQLKNFKKESLSNNSQFIVEVELTSLGWRIKKDEKHPDGKFVNYHHGKVNDINLSSEPCLEESNNDPIFILQKYFDTGELRTLSEKLLKNLGREVE